MEKIILLGGGGHCKSVIDAIESKNEYEISAIIDRPEKIGCSVCGYKIEACDDD
ncbi:MAG TPA: acetyltransferase, partial [Candidatus Wallbacteria bacterium]|nr:acetyltransferase [Candidatus Wallbacteria bacterium]